MSPLHWAAFNQDPSTCSILMKNGADPELMSIKGQIPIDIAGLTPSLPCVDVFLQDYINKFIDNSGKIKQKDIQRVMRTNTSNLKSGKHILRAATFMSKNDVQSVAMSREENFFPSHRGDGNVADKYQANELGPIVTDDYPNNTNVALNMANDHELQTNTRDLQKPNTGRVDNIDTKKRFANKKND